jgi:septum formation topological specificity factor MinE
MTDSNGELDAESSEISSVMTELKQVRVEQDKLLRMRSNVEQDLQKVRTKITLFEEEATRYLPEIQREILTLLCKLQQDQLNKMSIEIEAELKRRGSLLLRCLRQKALGEAIIHRQRHFISGTIININGEISSYVFATENKNSLFTFVFPQLFLEVKL